MVRKVLVTGLVVGVLAGLYLGVERWIVKPIDESWQMDAHVDEASSYTKAAEAKVTKYAVGLAQQHHALDEYSRGDVNARMQNLDRTRGELRLFASSIDQDTDGKVLQETIWKIQRKAVRNAEKKTGLDWNYDSQKPAMKEAMKAELEPFQDLLEMDRLLNKLTWNYGHRVLSKAFPNEKYPYTMERFMQDKAEYVELKAQLDVLLARRGLDK